MRLNHEQIQILSGYFSDISKIIVVSAVVGFFIPTGTGLISIAVFLVGSFAAVGFLLLSVVLVK